MIKPAPNLVSINLLPQRKTREGDSLLLKINTILRFLLVSLELIFIIALILYIKLLFDYTQASNRINKNLANITAAKNVEDHVNEIATRIKYIKQLQGTPDVYGKVIDSLENVFPTSITLTELRVESNKLTFTGTMVDINLLNILNSRVQKIPFLKNFTLTSLTIPSARNPSYTFSATYDIASLGAK